MHTHIKDSSVELSYVHRTYSTFMQRLHAAAFSIVIVLTGLFSSFFFFFNAPPPPEISPLPPPDALPIPARPRGRGRRRVRQPSPSCRRPSPSRPASNPFGRRCPTGPAARPP